MNKKQLKIVTGVAIAVLIVSIIPMLWISQYLHPFADDYVFGAEVYLKTVVIHPLNNVNREAENNKH